jgi:hypothetical protein
MFMKRLALVLFAAVVGAGMSATSVRAVPQTPDGGRQPGAVHSRGAGHGQAQNKAAAASSRRAMRKAHRFDPVRLALRHKGPGATETNYFDGHAYRPAGQQVRFNQLHLLHINRNGTYRVWFNGNSFHATAAKSGSQTILHVGTAPTREGYLYEFVLR